MLAERMSESCVKKNCEKMGSILWLIQVSSNSYIIFEVSLGLHIQLIILFSPFNNFDSLVSSFLLQFDPLYICIKKELGLILKTQIDDSELYQHRFIQEKRNVIWGGTFDKNIIHNNDVGESEVLKQACSRRSELFYILKHWEGLFRDKIWIILKLFAFRYHWPDNLILSVKICCQ